MYRTLVLLISLLLVYGCASTPKLSQVSDNYVVTIPGVSWKLEFPTGDLVPIINDERPGWAYYGLAHKSMARALEISKRGGDLKAAAKEIGDAMDKILNISFWIDRAEKCNNDAQKCRDNIWKEKKAQFPQMKNPLLSQEGEMYLSEFSLESKTTKGDFVLTHQMYVNLVRDGIWIDFHLSKASYQEQHRQLFIDFLKSIRFVPIAGGRDLPR